MDTSLSYLHTPSNSIINPPIDTTLHELPIEKLTWEDFEKLCLRMCQINYSIDDCDIYGIKGEKQQGIDIFINKGNGKYSSYQCKRYQSISTTTLAKIIKEFKKGTWFSKSEEFIICTTCQLNTVALQDKFEALKSELKANGVKLIKWDKENICRTLKNNPQIVYDFFGKEWVRHFNGKAKLKFITEKRKLDANGVLTYRKELHKFYSVLFNNHDTGIAIQELKGHSFQLQERFIIPDAIEKNSIDSYSLSFKEKPENNYEEYQDLFDESFPNSYASQNISQEIRRRQKDETKNTSEIRARIDTLLTKNRKSIVLGDPGSGKSTLLRNLVLDILSEKPKFSIFAQNWGSYLPIWLPFAFITKNLAENNNLSIAELLNIWLRSYDKEHLYDIVKNALEDERLLLIIDGIDESTDISSAQHAISKIDIHSVLNKTCIVYSSRPFGYKLLKDSLQKTREIYLQPFSKEQQKQYILYWYERWIESINNNDFDYARTQTIKFLDELSRSSELSIIAENPLLLSILVTQKLRDSVLPSNRLKALETITEYLIDVHPKKRASSANIIENEKFNFDLIEVFEELAIHIQMNINDGIIEKEEAKEIITKYLVQLMGYKTPEAKKYSDEIFNIGANHYGIIIEKTSTEISFTHRLFQEFLVAKYMNKSEDNNQNILSTYGGQPSWHQVIKFYFNLIPNRKINQFTKSVEMVGSLNTQKEFQQLITFLKFDIVLTLGNSPLHLAQKYFQDIRQHFEYETNNYSKETYWNIMLNALYHNKIKDEVSNYLFSYFPNLYKYNDYRTTALQNVSIDALSIIQREFLLKSLINGNTYQKLDASNVIRKFINDRWLYNKAIGLVEDNFNPDIVAFALNCFITDMVDSNFKCSLIEKYKNTEHPNISFFVIKLKVHLKIHSNDDLLLFIKLQTNIDYRLKDEVVNILIEGWTGNPDLLETSLISVRSKNYQERLLDPRMAWKILLKSFNSNQEVIDLIISNFTSESYPFGHDDHEVFSIIPEYFKNNEQIIPVIDDWIQRTKYNEHKIAYVSQVGRTLKTRNYLIEQLHKTNFSYWICKALIDGWQNDSEVMSLIKENFKTPSKNKYLSAHYADIIFADEKAEGIQILDDMIFNRNIEFRMKSIIGLIKLDKEYFRKKILVKFIIEELPHIPKEDFWGEYQSIVDSIVQNFKDEDVVRKEILPTLLKSPKNIHLIINQYPNEIESIDTLLIQSQPISRDFRLKLIEKFEEQSIVDSSIIEKLFQYTLESDANVKSTAAINYFNQIKHDPVKIVSICRSNVFYVGDDVEVQRQVSFCGYLIAKRLSEYFSIEDKEKKPASPFFSFDSYHNEISNTMYKLLIDNFEYLYNEIGKNFSKLDRSIKDDYQKYWGFWSKGSNEYSPTFKYIIQFIHENEDKITDGNLLIFLYRTLPQSLILKNICLRLVNSRNDQRSFLAAQILGRNFNKDEKVFQNLCDPTNYFDDEPKVLALSIGWPDCEHLRIIYNEYKSHDYRPNSYYTIFHLKFLFTSLESIMNFFKIICENYNDAKDRHKYFINPLLKRINQDIDLQNAIKTTLLSASSPSIKISFYSILNSFNMIDDEIVLWKKEQESSIDYQSYGYNVLTNELTLLSSTLNHILY